MEIYTTQQQLKELISGLKKQSKTIGFVPTMGALHQGHISLIIRSLQENDITVMSIFVNPTQFNNPEDLQKYPRTLQADVALIKNVSENVIIYAPEAQDIYGTNVISEKFDFDGLENVMEGAFRPGHFDGVGTVVKKLFEIVTPDKAYFGEKDFQQLLIIQKMVSKLGIPVQVIGCPIVREESGLALSSRNQRLSPKMKTESAYIYQVLKNVNEKIKTETIESIEKWVSEQFENKAGFELEYFVIADEQTLLAATEKEPNKKYRAFIVVFVEGVRLIDNMEISFC